MMSEKIRIGVIFGGRSGEHEVSLMSARSILSVLDPRKYQVTQIGITHSGHWLVGEGVLEALESGEISRLKPAAMLPFPKDGRIYEMDKSDQGIMLKTLQNLDVVFPVLHGTFGEDGTLQGLFELAEIAYVGTGVLASAVAMDKALFKDVMRAHGLPVLPSSLYTRSEILNHVDRVIADIEAKHTYPIFTKPANLGSSVGINKCSNREELHQGLIEAARFDRRVMAEQGINARDLEISVLGNENPRASLPGEICPVESFYSYFAKYQDDRTELVIPAEISSEIAFRMQKMAVQAYQAIDGAGLSRVDFLVEKETDKVYINEINTIPGFTRISMYPKLWEAMGISYSELVDQLIKLALERRSELDQLERSLNRRAG